MAQAGQRVGEYILESPVGSGTFGEVWRARHHVWTDQLVAIKIPADPQCLRNLQREGAAIHGLIHPNIVKAIAFDPYAPLPYLAMEYVPGTSLRPLIQTKSLPIPDAVSVMQQVLTGLKYAHANQVIHRDIKPENILVHERVWKEGFGAEGLVKLTDFGLGRSTGASAGSIVYSASLNSPAAREIAGTLDYMSPEQRGGAQLDARTDLYACGVVFYELLTGERPAGTDLPSDLNKSVPASMDDIFRRSYARLDKRFASADEFLAALAKCVQPASQVRPPPMPLRNLGSIHCPHCRLPVEPGDQFCMHCGVQLVATVRRCPRCNAYPDAKDLYCIFCGEVLKGQMMTA